MKVCILMSTFNGEKYLEEQLKSLIDQDIENIDILIRDDGSNDSTVEILKRWKGRYSNIFLLESSNVGVVKSFFDLIVQAQRKYDYFFFSDQDDIWLANKVSKAIQELKKYNKEDPLLYCSNKILVNSSNDRILNDVAINHKIEPNYYNSIVENIATGCTIGINQTLFRMVRNNQPNLDRVVMHDWWLYMIAVSIGKVIYDEQSYIRYRQHENNVIGAKTEGAFVWKRRISLFLKNKGYMHMRNQGHEFLICHGDKLTVKQKKELSDFVFYTDKSIFQRSLYILKTKLHYQDAIKDGIFKLMILLKMV